MIYVDDKQIPYGRMKMCHVVADTTAELEALARKIGIASKHIENRGEPNEHLNLSMTYRSKAIRAGAQEIDSRGLVKIIRKKRNMSPADRAGITDPEPKRGGVTIKRRGHASSCAVNNAPAYDPGPCDCGYEDVDDTECPGSDLMDEDE